MTLEENVRETLGSVRRAISRIDEGEYDVCERCGQKISAERLQAIPTATMCIKCKSDEESR
jgi:DnaK suppressor protein